MISARRRPRAPRAVLDGVAHRTPPITSRTLGEHVVVKPECLQRGGAFKFRGAYNKIASLPPARRSLAFSSGNHAQAVALAARLLGSQATILMPDDAPAVEARRDARLRRRDRHATTATATTARRSVQQLAAERGLELVRPYDDPLMMAGAGTAALELLEDAGSRRHARRRRSAAAA